MASSSCQHAAFGGSLVVDSSQGLLVSVPPHPSNCVLGFCAPHAPLVGSAWHSLPGLSVSPTHRPSWSEVFETRLKGINGPAPVIHAETKALGLSITVSSSLK